MARRPEQPEPRWPAKLTEVAFAVAISLVVARATFLQTIRDPVDIVPGAAPVPRGPGAATSLVLDWLCCLPALLVLARRAIDPAFRLRFSMAHALFSMVALWAAISVVWSSDKFVAMVQASNLVASAAVAWAFIQLVRSWVRLRLVAGACFGLLLVHAAHGMIYRFIDVPDNIRFWQEHREVELARRGWQPDSFQARQFEQKVIAGEMVGFGASPNTFAAMIVLLGTVAAGAAVQRTINRDEPGWPAVVILGLVPAAWIATYTHSRTALLTPFIAAIILIALWRARTWMCRHHRAVYFTAAACAVAVGSLLVLQGVGHGALFHDSLTFRWRYWIGSARVFEQSPVLGVGWSNFGAHYLGVRLPEASEEIKDPHNFLVRAFVELGAIGGMLMLAWVARLWWELTKPADHTIPLDADPKSPQPALRAIAAISSLAMLINVVASIDFGLPTLDQHWYAMLELMKRLLFGGLLMLGLAAVTLQSSQRPQLDDRPAPWVLYAALAAIAVFLLHNLLDFSMFETGPMFVLATLIGCGLGMSSSRPDAVGQRTSRVPAAWLALAAIVWLACGLAVVVPVVHAESIAQRADEELRGGRAAASAQLYRQAFQAPWISNADYAYRSARAMMFAGQPAGESLAVLDAAIATDPMSGLYRLTRARYLLRQQPPDYEQIIADFASAIALNPNDVPTHIEYAESLAAMGQKLSARDQYRQALRFNDLLSPAEPKRLTPQQIADIERRIRSLE